MRTRRLAVNAIVHLTLVVAALLALFPLFWVLLTSFKTNRDAAAPAERAFVFDPTSAMFTLIRAFCFVLSIKAASSCVNWVFFCVPPFELR